MEKLKSIFCDILVGFKLDALFRYLNRNKLLVINYHGITNKRWPLPAWGQLHEDIFKMQIQYLKKHYRILSLSEVIAKLFSGSALQGPTAIITFDDGLKNNYSVAFDVLKKYSVPATIFLTVDLVGTENIIWTDKLFLLLYDAMIKKIPIKQITFSPYTEITPNNILDIYWSESQILKESPKDKVDNYLISLMKTVDTAENDLKEDFKMLTWDMVLEMAHSGLVDFGVHTANHRILSRLTRDEWKKEIKKPKEKLSKIINKEVLSFCFPNGRAGIDFDESHITYLKKCGYSCAFTTESDLFCPNSGNPYTIGRIPAGNNFQSQMSYFRLNTSGFGKYLRKIKAMVNRHN